MSGRTLMSAVDVCICRSPTSSDVQFRAFSLTLLLDSQQHRAKYSISGPPTKQLTPPPSLPSTPRQFLELQAPATPPYDESRRRYVAPALNRAFSSEDEDEHDEEQGVGDSTGPSLFPTSMYRTRNDSKRISVSSRPGISLSPARDMIRSAGAAPRNTTRSSERQDSRKESRSMTPELRNSNVAPMSAAFARLSHKVSVASLQAWQFSLVWPKGLC